jgi:predicted nucleic acid-binding protein
MRLALGKVVKARWSERVHEEWMRNIHTDYSDITKEDLRRIRNLMDEALPEALTEGYENRIEDLSLPDPSDRHVLAAATHAEADYIVTFNRRDFPVSELGSWDIEAIGPDELVSGLFDPVPDRIIEVARVHRTSLTRPSKTPEGYLEMLRNCGLEETARLLEEHMDRI